MYGVKTYNRIVEANMLSSDFLNDKDVSSSNSASEFYLNDVKSLKNILDVIDED